MDGTRGRVPSGPPFDPSTDEHPEGQSVGRRGRTIAGDITMKVAWARIHLKTPRGAVNLVAYLEATDETPPRLAARLPRKLAAIREGYRNPSWGSEFWKEVDASLRRL